jgi:hypothetical protein
MELINVSLMFFELFLYCFQGKRQISDFKNEINHGVFQGEEAT